MRRSLLAVVSAIVMLVAGLIATPIAQAAPAPVPKTFSVFLSFTDWETYGSGVRGGVGDLSVFTGPVSTSYQGSRAGTYTITARVISREGSGRRAIDTRDTQVRVDLAGGAVLAQSVTEDPSGKPPTGLHILPVVGGTGEYASARGTVIIRSIGSTGVYSLGYDIFVDRSWSKEKIRVSAPEISVVGVDDSAAASGVQSAEPGDVIITTRSRGDQRMVIASTVLERTDRNVRYSHDVLIERSGYQVLARGETIQKPNEIPAQVKTTFAILGATKERAFQRGQVTLIPSSSGSMSLRIKWSAPAGGKQARRTWFEDVSSTTTSNVFGQRGGTVTASVGDMRNKASNGRDLGDLAVLTQAFSDHDWWMGTAEQTFSEGTMVLAGFGPLKTQGNTWVVIGGTGNFGGTTGVVGPRRSGDSVKLKATYRR